MYLFHIQPELITGKRFGERIGPDQNLFIDQAVAHRHGFIGQRIGCGGNDGIQKLPDLFLRLRIGELIHGSANERRTDAVGLTGYALSGRRPHLLQ